MTHKLTISARYFLSLRAVAGECELCVGYDRMKKALSTSQRRQNG
jgi:hypothetical protein